MHRRPGEYPGLRLWEVVLVSAHGQKARQRNAALPLGPDRWSLRGLKTSCEGNRVQIPAGPLVRFFKERRIMGRSEKLADMFRSSLTDKQKENLIFHEREGTTVLCGRDITFWTDGSGGG